MTLCGRFSINWREDRGGVSNVLTPGIYRNHLLSHGDDDDWDDGDNDDHHDNDDDDDDPAKPCVAS